MATLKIRVNDKILDKIVWLLNQFKKEEVEMIGESETFINNPMHLQKELFALGNPDSKFYSLDEVEELLEKTISKHDH